jgi:hypothetical protein
MSSNAEAWRILFDALELAPRLADGVCVRLAADDIKRISGREPRLMTKFDTRESRPALLSDVTILPESNGSYVLLPGDGYADLTLEPVLRRFTLPEGASSLKTLPWKRGPVSESQAIDMAIASGLLHDFLGDPEARLTIRGRLRAPAFDFSFPGRSAPVDVHVAGVQIEVDAGLEGEQVSLVEAKLGSRTNFLVRQLYYPFRMWRTLVPDKPVVPVFVTWSNRRFELRRFAFTPESAYGGLMAVDAASYALEDDAVPTLAAVLDRAKPAPLPEAPFPQADEVRKVIDVVDAVAAGVNLRTEIAERFDFDERQADYYGNAAAFLGLVTRARLGFELSELGRRFSNADLAERQWMLLETLAGLPVFREALAYCLAHGTAPELEQLTEWVSSSTELGGATPRRRAFTALSWTRWALDATTPRAAER